MASEGGERERLALHVARALRRRDRVFRRGPLALGDEEARLTPRNPLRLALRALEPLRRLRDRTRARVIHDDRWAAAFRTATG